MKDLRDEIKLMSCTRCKEKEGDCQAQPAVIGETTLESSNLSDLSHIGMPCMCGLEGFKTTVRKELNIYL